MNKSINVVYVGRKNFKADTIANTSTIWLEYGDVQEVEAQAAVKLLKHKDVWVTESVFKRMPQDLEPLPEPEPEPAPKIDDIPTIDFDSIKKPPSHEPPKPGLGDGLVAEPSAELLKALTDIRSENNPDSFTNKNMPKIDVVRARAGGDVGVADLNAAWKQVNGV